MHQVGLFRLHLSQVMVSLLGNTTSRPRFTGNNPPALSAASSRTYAFSDLEFSFSVGSQWLIESSVSFANVFFDSGFTSAGTQVFNVALTVPSSFFTVVNCDIFGSVRTFFRVTQANGNITMDSCNFTSVTSSAAGAAISVGPNMANDGSITIRNCHFDGCQSTGRGGCIAMGQDPSENLLFNARSLISNCTFLNSNAASGGAINLNSGSHVVSLR